MTSATGAVTVCGVLMLCLGILAPRPDFTWLDPDFADMVRDASQFVPSLIGAGLLVMAIGLSLRVNLAWVLTVVLLLAGAVFAASQGGLLWVSGVLVLTTMLLAPFRRCFYRHANLLSGPLQASSALSLLALVICLIALAVSRPKVDDLVNDAWWAVIASPHVPHALRFAVAMAVGLALIALWMLIRPSRVQTLAWDAAARDRYRRFGAAPPLEADGLLMGEAQRAGLAYRRIGGLLVGLGDPVGSQQDRLSVVWRFRDLARQEGLGPAIWRAEPGLLEAYADIGMVALPLGEDGRPTAETQDQTPPARHYLVGVPERDLGELLPLLDTLSATPSAT